MRRPGTRLTFARAGWSRLPGPPAREHASDLGAHRQEAHEAEVRAEAARLEAERARREADEASTALAQQEAVREDRLREADRLDPTVDHKADDYRPTTGEALGDEKSGSGRPPPCAPDVPARRVRTLPPSLL